MAGVSAGAIFLCALACGSLESNHQAVQLVHLRYFAGLSLAEAADLLAISPRTAGRLWAYAKAWLHQEITGSSEKFKND